MRFLGQTLRILKRLCRHDFALLGRFDASTQDTRRTTSGCESLRKRFFKQALSLVSLFLLSILINNCAVYKSNPQQTFVKDCQLPSSQANSLQGHWRKPPIKFSFFNVNGQFLKSDVNAIQAAANTWNTFFTTTKGGNIFDSGPAGVGYQSTLAQDTPNCNTTTISDGTVLYKRYNGWTKSPVAVAVTTYCFRRALGTQTTNEMYNAIMEFNFQNFFTQNSGHYPDFQSIALHELGHLLGLDHSCGPLGQSRAGLTNAGCPDPNADPTNSLFSTVMFPQVFFDTTGNGEVKQQLDSNDEGRANCVY